MLPCYNSSIYTVLYYTQNYIITHTHTHTHITLGRPKHRWEDIIKMDLQELGCGSMDWIELAQDRDRWRALVNAGMNLLVT